MTNRVEAPADTNTQKILRDLKNVVREAESLLANASGDSSLIGEDVRSKLSSALEGAKTTYLDLQEKVVTGAKRTDELIRENPYPSMGIAFGCGVLVGYLVTRSK